jgi:hypothetical protein
LALLASAPAMAATWTLHKFPADGFGIESPVPLTRSTGTYKAAVAGTIPTTIYSGEADNIRYSVTIIDISNRIPDAVTLFKEAEFLLQLTGKVVSDAIIGIEPGVARNYGAEFAIERPDGSFAITSLLYSKGKIYRSDAVVLPGGDKTAPEPQRFADSIIFALEGPLRVRDETP